MSLATTNALEQVAKVLQSDANVSTTEKIAVLQAFAATFTENLSIETSKHILQAVPLGLFYYGFSSEDDQLTLVLCELIRKLLQPFTYEYVVSAENKNYLLQGLTHFTPEIRYLALQQVFKCLASDASVSTMVDSEIFPLVLATIAFQDARTANKASELVYRASATPSGQAAFFGITCTSMLKQLLLINGVISFRVYDLIIKVATYSDSAFEACESSGLLSVFIKELESDDLLVKINAIELLNEIATTAAGLSFLEKAQLLGTITTVLDNPDDSEVVVQLVKCAVIKFIGNLGENEQIPFESMSTKYNIMEKIQDCLETQNIEILIVAISTIGLVGSRPAGLRLLTDSLLAAFFSRYATAVGQVKAVYLQSISKLISVRDGTEQVEKLTMDIYERIQGQPSTLSSLIKEAKQPEDSIRVASFAVMQAIACHAWGVELMAQSNEFISYILNRSTEHTEQGQNWKYAIIQTLISSPDAPRVLNGGDHYAQLKVYVAQGAHFRILEPIAAVESS